MTMLVRDMNKRLSTRSAAIGAHFALILLVPVLGLSSGPAHAQTKAALFNNSADYMAFIEKHPGIHIVAVTTLEDSQAASVAALPKNREHSRSAASAADKKSVQHPTQLIVTYEETATSSAVTVQN